MKHAVKILIKSPAAFVIIILLFLLILLFSVRAISKSSEVVNNMEHGESITQVEYAKSR
jgi:CHASE3 domain sensor protein